MSDNIDLELFRKLTPINSLSNSSLEKLEAKIQVENLAAGRTFFNRGEIDGKTIFLLSGCVELIDENNNSIKISSGEQKSNHPIAHQQPRKFTALTLSVSTIAIVDSDFLDILLTWEQSAGYVVEEISPDSMVDESADWMTKMLQSNIFFKVPPANIQSIFTRMEPVYASQGEKIITQGDAGDYYYIMKRGIAEVVRVDNANKEFMLAQMKSGDGFGEEALMSDTTRNATVRMKTDGELMRLSKNNFTELLKEPLLKAISYEDALTMKREGVVLVDVRLESEYENDHIPGSINMPLYLLRLKCKDLDDSAAVIVYCDSGGRSSSAAYILSKDGFDVYVIDGGLLGLKG